MKYKMIIKINICIIVISVVLTLIPDNGCNVSEAQLSRDKKACWVSYQDISNHLRDKDESEFRQELSLMYDVIIDKGLNTVIMHVRAMGDAMYPSSFFPWSTYITSDRKALSYDPLKIMIEMARDKNLNFEAWINPYRISLSETTTNSFKNTGYYKEYMDIILEYENSGGETCLVLDPAKEGARELITKGVMEIVNNYDIDAIHFDDYFYVDGMAVDLSIENKKQNVNLLINKVYNAIKSKKADCQFGISPAGNLANARAQGADIDTWMSVDGYIDYIMPQIYWSDYYETGSEIVTMYSDRCKEWQDMNKIDIPVYVGLALYRVGEKSDIDKGWTYSNDNLLKQYKIATELGYEGYALFRYEWLKLPIAKDELDNLNNYIQILGYKCPTDMHSFVSYVTKVEDYGWQTVKSDGISSGTTIDNKSIEAIGIALGDKTEIKNITYRIYSKSHKWMEWTSNGVITNSQNPDICGLEIKLGDDSNKVYNVEYRVNVEGVGWMDWVKNGETAGMVDFSKSINAVQIKLTLAIP